jgi:hypothetical protein
MWADQCIRPRYILAADAQKNGFHLRGQNLLFPGQTRPCFVQHCPPTMSIGPILENIIHAS